jgi:hypothetical protein
MADPLSIAGRVADLPSLSSQMTGILHEHVISGKNAQKKTTEMTGKLTALISVLKQLKQFIESQAASGTFEESSVLYGTTKHYNTSLEDLNATMPQCTNFSPTRATTVEPGEAI